MGSQPYGGENMATSEGKNISIGIDDFKELIEENYYFTDKSLLIKELLDSKAKVTLLPRPRRFGKTLNMSMLRCFFEKVDPSASRRHLFNGLKIEQYPNCMIHQGKYPTIWLTFKDVKMDTWLPCYEKMRTLVGIEFKRHFDAIKTVLNELEMQEVQALMAGTASQAMYENSLLELSRYLERAYKTRVMILIDEYDAPIHAGYLNGYYKEIIGFMRGFFGAGLKGNDSLNLSVMTGILRVAKESIFSGINHLEVRTFFQQDYSDKFGFLEDEVVAMLNFFGLDNHIDKVRQWYDGYQSGPLKVYNPWSIINLVKSRGELQTYWANTSDNLLVRDLLKKSQIYVKEEVEKLMRGQTVNIAINENITLPDIDHDENALWNFLLFTGYVTFRNYHQEGRAWYADLKIPNEEIASLYETSVLSWFKEKDINQDYLRMLSRLTEGDVAEFKRMFELFTYEALSSFDITGREPERLYHAFTVGMFAALHKSHEVRSNRESGLGRYDVSLIPKDPSKPGIIFELKKVNKSKNETLESAAQDALTQINARDYEAEMRSRNFKNIIKLGIAFQGKESLVLIGETA